MRTAFLLLAIVLSGSPRKGSTEAIRTVSLVQLLSNPSTFNGKRVCVIGYLSTGFEDQRIWLSQTDHAAYIWVNSVLWATPDRFSSPSIQGYAAQPTDGFALVEGVFHAGTNEHSDFSSYIDSITRIAKWDSDRFVVTRIDVEDAGVAGKSDAH